MARQARLYVNAGMRLVGDARSANVAMPVGGKRGAQNGIASAAPDASPTHIEIEQRLEAESCNSAGVRLGHTCAATVWSSASGPGAPAAQPPPADEAVEQHGNRRAARGQRGARMGGELAAAQLRPRQRISRHVGRDGRVPCRSHRVRAGHDCRAGPRRPSATATAEQRGGNRRGCGGVAAFPISPRQTRSASRTAS